MQIVSFGDSLHEMSKPIFLIKYETVSLLSADVAQRVVKVNSLLVLKFERPF